ncbi:MAG: purine-nucleoside phosphorylase [Salibacteraceae bacterium]
MSLSDRINETVASIYSRIKERPTIGVVLGTGLGGFVNQLDIELEIPYASIPHFPVSTVQGHDGKLIFGTLLGKPVLAMKGRFHYYEGYSMSEVTYPIRVMKELGIQSLLLSNASGGVNPEFKIGDIMVVHDHINLFPSNPLIGSNDNDLGSRFPDMSEPYDRGFIQIMERCAVDSGISIQKGVYAGVPGPCFETPAEYKYLRVIGADAVGMSTVPENIVARHAGMKVAALSVITDLGIEGKIEKISHEEVQQAAAQAEPKMAELVKLFFARL